MSSPTRRTFRRRLGSTVASAAGPYGYTISLGGSIALGNDRLGTPHLFGALMMMAGAVLAFVVLEAFASTSDPPEQAEPDRPPSMWANAHFASAGAALCGVWAVVHLVGGELAWVLVGFTATGLYFLVTTFQRIVLDAA